MGEKGIGRFAAARIGSSLEIISQPLKSESKYIMNFEWNDFDKKYLSEIEIEYSKEPIRIKEEHGLKLKIQNLYTYSLTVLVKNTHLALIKLLTEIKEEIGNFDVYIQIKGNTQLRKNYAGKLKPSPLLENYRYRIKGDVFENGRYNLEIEYPNKDDPIPISGVLISDKRKIKKKEEINECGPFELDVRVWDRDNEALKELNEVLQLKRLKDVRELLDNNLGLYVYRDGFRIFPYGDQGYDWLELNKRRFQNPSLRLSNNQISGKVLISRVNNPELRDSSHRQGFIDTLELLTLKQRITDTFALLEPFRFDYRKEIRDSREVLKSRSLIFDRFELESIRDAVEAVPVEHRGNLNEILEEKEKDIEKSIDIIKRQLVAYRRLSAMGIFADRALHEINTNVGIIKNKSRAILRYFNRLRKNQTQNIDELEVKEKTSYLESILASNSIIYQRMKLLEPFSGRTKSSRKTNESIYNLIKITLENSQSFILKKYKISKDFPILLNLKGKDCQIRCTKGDWMTIFQNLIDNSIYWGTLQNDKLEITIELEKVGKWIIINFEDNGMGIDSKFVDSIFEPYFSTKPDGIGLGLTIIGEIILDEEGEIALVVSEKGAKFQLRIPKEKEVIK